MLALEAATAGEVDSLAIFFGRGAAALVLSVVALFEVVEFVTVLLVVVVVGV